jgi:hypothetical protein
MNRAAFKVIRTDGTDELIQQAPTLDAIYRAIGCHCATNVTLDKRRSIIMYADDAGMFDWKPINGKATERMRKAFPGHPYSIHGDVAIVND